jgi:hypothetical protein
MLGKEYPEMARTLFLAARSLADRAIADWLRALAEDYEQPAEAVSSADAPNAPARQAGMARAR